MFNPPKNILIRFLILIVISLYVLFIYMDIYNKNLFTSSNKIKFISISLCFMISILTKKDSKNSKDISLLQVGLLLTLMADYIFLIYNKQFIIAIGLFSIVQILYFIRYKRNNIKQDIIKQDIIKQDIIKILVIFSTILIIYFFIYYFIIKIDFILAIGLFYAICLLMSIKAAIYSYKNRIYLSPNKEMILIGMILFLLCDINVAIYNGIDLMEKTSKIWESIEKISFLSIWIFYLPSQLLLSLSGYGCNPCNK